MSLKGAQPVETPGLKFLEKKKKEEEPVGPKLLPPSLGEVIIKQKVSKRRKHVFFDILIEGDKDKGGRVVFELFNDICPITVENFRCLCTGERGMGKRHKLAYEGSPFHRIVKGQLVQGGDLAAKLGLKAGECIYGRSFDDENFLVNHSAAGLLSMANNGPNTNSSQFFVTLDKLPHLDNKHVVFGKVISGLNVIRNIGELPIGVGEKPLRQATISKCGEIQLVEDQTEANEERLKREKEEREKREQELKEKVEEESSKTMDEIASAVQEGLKRQSEKKKEEAPTKKRRKNFMSYGDPALDDLLDDE